MEKINLKKKRKPTFTRQDSHKKVRVGSKWRRSRGLQSKMRLSKKGYKRSPEIGWGSPKAIKGLSPDGKREILIKNKSDIETIKEKEIALISSKVGKKLKMELVKILTEKKIEIRNVDIKKLKEQIDSIQKAKKSKLKKRQNKAAKKEEKKEEKKETLAEKLTEEDKKKAEKAEKDKIIIKKE